MAVWAPMVRELSGFLASDTYVGLRNGDLFCIPSHNSGNYPVFRATNVEMQQVGTGKNKRNVVVIRKQDMDGRSTTSEYEIDMFICRYLPHDNPPYHVRFPYPDVLRRSEQENSLIRSRFV